jgi:hypothetical protein
LQSLYVLIILIRIYVLSASYGRISNDFYSWINESIYGALHRSLCHGLRTIMFGSTATDDGDPAPSLRPATTAALGQT